MRLKVGEVSYALSIDHAAQGPMNIQVATIAAQPDSQATHQPAPQTFRVEVIADEAPQVELVIDGLRLSAKSVPTPEGGWLDALGVCSDYVDLADRAPSQASSSGAGSVISSMHGTLVKLAVAPEQKVQRGEFVLAIEAMKMEHRIEAPVTGTVVEIGAEVGAHISPGRLLVRIEPELE